MLRGLKCRNQQTEREQDLFARPSLQCGGFWPFVPVAELFAQKGNERSKLRDRSIQKLPRCDPHRKFPFQWTGGHITRSNKKSHKTPADKQARAPMDTGIIERCSLIRSADVARRVVRPLLLRPDARDLQ